MNQIMENKKLLACIVIALILGGGLYLFYNKSKALKAPKTNYSSG